VKIHIAFDFKDGPWGGGNQFLKALREQWRNKGVYAENMVEAEAYLVNAFPSGNMNNFLEPVKQKLQNDKFIFYRLDGLYYCNRIDERQKYIDDVCTYFANNFTDGIIYQTNWIKEIQQSYGIHKTIKNIVAINAPDSSIFTRKEIKFPQKEEKIKLVATCWAPNERKGFKFYKFLDENLDFDKYEMVFIGNSPVKFKNIKMKPPATTRKIAEELMEHHAFVSCAFNEPCSNSLIEAMHVGLPALGHNSGGSPDIIQQAGELFNDEMDLLESIDKLGRNLKMYSDRINLPTIEDVAEFYYQLMLTKKNNPIQVTKKNYRDFFYLLRKYNLVDTKLDSFKKKVKNNLKISKMAVINILRFK